MKTYQGGCHCGAVRYEVEAELEKTIECNCSFCQKMGALLIFVDKEKFKVLSGTDSLTEYLFNKKQIRHLFCRICGIESYSEGISFPKVAINVRCLDGVDVTNLARTPFNGRDM